MGLNKGIQYSLWYKLGTGSWAYALWLPSEKMVREGKKEEQDGRV